MQMQQKNILEKELIKAKLGKRQRGRKGESDDESGELEDSYRSNSSSDRSRSRSSSESSYEQQSKLRAKRQSKFEEKRNKRHEYQIESSEDQSSISSDHYYDRKNVPKRKDKGNKEMTLDKPVELKDFQKICIRRRDLVRWIDHPDYQEGIRGGFVRVTYQRNYVIGQIERFKVGTETYRVDHKETKLIVELRNADKLKDFKLNAISDQKCQQSELNKLLRDNKKLVLNYEFLQQIKQ